MTTSTLRRLLLLCALSSVGACAGVETEELEDSFVTADGDLEEEDDGSADRAGPTSVFTQFLKIENLQAHRGNASAGEPLWGQRPWLTKAGVVDRAYDTFRVQNVEGRAEGFSFLAERAVVSVTNPNFKMRAILQVRDDGTWAIAQRTPFSTERVEIAYDRLPPGEYRLILEQRGGPDYVNLTSRCDRNCQFIVPSCHPQNLTCTIDQAFTDGYVNRTNPDANQIFYVVPERAARVNLNSLPPIVQSSLELETSWDKDSRNARFFKIFQRAASSKVVAYGVLYETGNQERLVAVGLDELATVVFERTQRRPDN